VGGEKFQDPAAQAGVADEQLDWNAGRLLDAVKELGLDENTYVIFTSDNGPWWIKKEKGGNAEPLRGAKTSTWEGGLRVPSPSPWPRSPLRAKRARQNAA
jgi:arylsulfatase A-like enzyme